MNDWLALGFLVQYNIQDNNNNSILFILFAMVGWSTTARDVGDEKAAAVLLMTVIMQIVRIIAISSGSEVHIYKKLILIDL